MIDAVALQAGRLVDLDRLAEALHLRRELADRVRPHLGALGDPAREGLALTLADQAHDLRRANQPVEALEAAGEAAELVSRLVATETSPGDQLDLQLLVVSELALSLQSAGEPDEATEALESLFERLGTLRRTEDRSLPVAYAWNARRIAAQGTADESAVERRSSELLESLDITGREDTLRPRVRGWAALGSSSVTWTPLTPGEALEPQGAPTEPAAAVSTDTPVPPPRAVPHPAPSATPGASTPPDRVTPVAGPEEAERPAFDSAGQMGEQPSTEEQSTAEPDLGALADPSPGEAEHESALPTTAATAAVGASADLGDLQRAYEAARASGDRSGALHAAQDWVDAARGELARDETRGGPALVQALRALGDARFRSGDWWGSRQPNKEAKALAKRLGNP